MADTNSPAPTTRIVTIQPRNLLALELLGTALAVGVCVYVKFPDAVEPRVAISGCLGDGQKMDAARRLAKHREPLHNMLAQGIPWREIVAAARHVARAARN